nr:MAG TPA: DNA circularization protein [Caudoviricetes sp.]
MANFSEKLYPASYKGVPFSVTDASLTVGRRSQVFEYPQRDEPYVEDLGRAARTITLTAVFAGPDYVTAASRLIEAVEDGDPGILVHPFLGRMWVMPTTSSRVIFSARELGYSTIDLTFTESGAYEFPTTAADTGALTLEASETVKKTAREAFASEFSLEGRQDFIRDAVKEHLSAFFDLDDYKEAARLFNNAEAMAKTAAGAVDAVTSDAESFASAISSAFSFSAVDHVVDDWRRVSRILTRLAESAGLHKTFDTGLAPQADAADYTELSSVVQDLARQTVLAEAIAATASVGGTEDTAAGGIAYEDYIEIRDGVLEAIDREELTAGDDTFIALEDARAAVADDLTTRAEDAARLVTITPAEVSPALVIAYDFYGDASRESEIIARNSIRHGGFVPSEPLKVLSR